MSPICRICGNASHAPGATSCAICRAPLPKTSGYRARGAVAPSGAPALVTPGGRKYRLSTTSPTLIGSRGCAVTLSEPGVAPRHAQILPMGRGYGVEDLGGGTRVKGVPVTGRTPLQSGDAITVGAVDLVYQGPSCAKPSAPSRPVPPSRPSPAPARLPWRTAAPAAAKSRGVLADGEVVTVDPERQGRPPFDPGRALVILSVVLILLGLCGAAAFFSLAVCTALLIIGLGGAGCTLPLMFPMLLPALRPLFDWLRGEEHVSMLSFQVLDSRNGNPVDVTLIRQRGGAGNVRLGDKVRVQGSRQASGLVRAHTVQVYESGGHPADFTVDGMKPWPLWPGLLVLGLTAGSLLLVVLMLSAPAAG